MTTRPTRLLTPADLPEAADALLAGQLVVFPTDTVYGVAALATDETAVAALFDAKGRDAGVALPVMIGSVDLLMAVARPAPRFAELVAAFWPGALTIVLPKTGALPDRVTAGGPTVGLRIPDHRLTLDLLRRVNRPLAVTSANRSGEPPARTAAEAQAQLGGRVDIIIDGGPAPGGDPSTVLDLTVAPPRILRAGPISAEALTRILGGPVASG